MTLSAGLRFDHFANSAPESVAGPTQLLPARNLVFPATNGVNFKDLTPKLGAVYDLTGDGNHLSVQGLASLASVAWAALLDAIKNRP